MSRADRIVVTFCVTGGTLTGYAVAFWLMRNVEWLSQ